MQGLLLTAKAGGEGSVHIGAAVLSFSNGCRTGHPKVSPAHAGGSSLGLTQVLPHTLLSMAMASEASPRISVLYSHPGHGTEPCQESNTTTLQFQFAP